MHHPADRIAHTTAFVTPVVEHWLEREIVKRNYYSTSCSKKLLYNIACKAINEKAGRYQVRISISDPTVFLFLFVCLFVWFYKLNAWVYTATFSFLFFLVFFEYW